MATTFPVTARLREADPGIRSGMAAEVDFRFPVPGGSGRMLVTAVAVGEDRPGRFVFVLDRGSATVHRRAVTVGDLTAEGLEVLSGLEAGDLIVTAGVRRLTDGERVLVQEAGA
jgi:multidrug efflux pump subunit AcrA (membrane-fusion protein)